MRPMRKLGIYVHIPFCVKKCRYCDFLSFLASEEEKREYVHALLKEIEREAVHYTDFIVDSVFIGGGTPSALPEGAVEEILDCLRRFYHFSDVSSPGKKRNVTGTTEMIRKTALEMMEEPEITEITEITIEVNPGSVDRKKLQNYRRAGVNRISIGTQSVHEKELAYLGRIHKAKDFFQTYQDAEEVGFTNINVDVMAALPGQSVADYMDNLGQIAELEPAHISAYSLMIEEGTPFYEMYGGEKAEKRKECVNCLPLPSEEEEREMYVHTDTFLRGRGYYRYEISNYAIPGMECRHNVGYWKRKDYVGFGLGASSLVDNVRWKNLSDMKEYIRRIHAGSESIREDVSQLSKQEQMEEYMFLGLRLTKGVGRREFQKTFGRTVDEVYGTVIEKLRGQGLLEAGEDISLTPYGRDISNYVMAEFLF